MESIIRIAEVLNTPVRALFKSPSDSSELTPEDDWSDRQDDLFSKAFKHALQLIVITDPDGTILCVNQSVLDFSGHTQRDLVGKSLMKSSLWKNFDDSAYFLNQGIEQARWGSLFKEELRIVSHDDEEHEAICFVSPVQTNDRDKLDVELLVVECYL